MSFKIDKLTLEQEALIQKIRDEWLQIALDTSPSDKQKAEEAINFVYECGGLKPPLVWYDRTKTSIN